MEPGEAILPAAKLIAILRETRDSELSIETDPSACIVKGPSLEFEMPSEDPSQFPDLPTFAEDKFHEITSGSLREMIRRTVFAAADETARYSMTGVLWELEDNVARLVATDGRRLALAQGTATGHGGHTTRGQAPVVPTKAMSLLERNLQDDEETVKICLRPNEVLFRTERAVVYSRLVEGRFPDYRQVMPKKQAVRIVLHATPFQTAVRQAAIMTDEDSKRVTFRFSKDNLTLKAQGTTAGRSKVELPIEYDGKTHRDRLQSDLPGGHAQGAAARCGADLGSDRRGQSGPVPQWGELLVFGHAADINRNPETRDHRGNQKTNTQTQNDLSCFGFRCFRSGFLSDLVFLISELRLIWLFAGMCRIEVRSGWARF